MTRMSGHSDATKLVKQTVALVQGFEDPLFAPFQSRLAALDLTADLPTEPRHLPVVDTLDRLEHGQAHYADVLESLKALRDKLAWGQTYNKTDFGSAFLNSYGWVYIVGPKGMVKTNTVLCAYMLLGSETVYPLHRHHAEEIYICVSGDVDFRHDATTWQHCAPGAFVHHPPLKPHALRTGAEPCLLIALWHGDDLSEKSEILERAQDD